MTESSQGTYKNLVEMLDNSRKRYAEHPLFGTKRDGNYEWTTYEKFAERVKKAKIDFMNFIIERSYQIARDDEILKVTKDDHEKLGPVFDGSYLFEDETPEE